MVVSTPRLPAPGETVMGNEFAMHAGGKGANQAVACARTGAEVVFIARVGDDDFGGRAIEGFRTDGIITDFVIRDPSNPSGIAMILVEEGSGENSIVVAGGANNAVSPEDITLSAAAFEGADALLVQLETPLEAVEAALRSARSAAVRTILNPAPAQELGDELLSLVDIITPNETEAALLTGLKVESEEEIRAAAKALLEKVGEAVIITLGARGCFLKTRDGMEAFLDTSPVRAVDTTAAGDCFNGYLAARLSMGDDHGKAIDLSMRAATLSVTRHGAQPSIPHLAELTY